MKNIFVLFSPGTGGNHLANLLSTDSRFITRCNVEDYSNHTGINAHTSQIKNLSLNDVNMLADNNNVLCGHFGEYYWLFLSGLIEKFDNRQIFIIQVPERNTFAWKRYTKLNPMSDYFYEEQRSLYTIEIVQKVFNEQDIVSLPGDLLFQSDFKKLQEYICNECDINMHIQNCKQMHTVWYDKLQSSIDV